MEAWDEAVRSKVAANFTRDRFIPDFYERLIDDPSRHIQVWQTRRAYELALRIHPDVVRGPRGIDKHLHRLTARSLGIPRELVQAKKHAMQMSSGGVDTLVAQARDALSREVMHVLASKVIGADITLLDDNTNFMDKVRDLPAVPDVIFLDIQMRPHDGYEMLKMLRGDSMYKEATVIAMTASVMATDVQALRAAGFNGLIGKPILRQVFPSLLKQILTGEPVWFVS